MRKLSVLSLGLLVLSGCSGDSTAPGTIVTPPPPPPPPIDTRAASVVIVSGKYLIGRRVELALRNDSGPGAYYVEFRLGGAYGNVPGRPDPIPFNAKTSPVDVLPAYAETLTYQLDYDLQTHVVDWAKVYSRATNSGAWKLTSCWQYFGKC